jgi:DNA polymerase-3 subunit gamma/tau
LEEHIRHLLIARATGSTKLLETSDYFKNRYEEKAALHAEKDLLQYLDILTRNESLLKYAENPQLILELLLLKLAHKPLAVDLEELLELLKNLPNSPGGAGNLTTSPPPNPTPAAPSPKPKTTTPESLTGPFKSPPNLTGK